MSSALTLIFVVVFFEAFRVDLQSLKYIGFAGSFRLIVFLISLQRLKSSLLYIKHMLRETTMNVILNVGCLACYLGKESCP